MTSSTPSNIDDILRRLSSFSKQDPDKTENSRSDKSTASPVPRGNRSDQVSVPRPLPTTQPDGSIASHLAQLQKIVSNAKATAKPQHPTPSNPSKPSWETSHPDAHQITEWGPALRHVKRLEASAPSGPLEYAIRTMVRQQRQHEKTWFVERSRISNDPRAVKEFDIKVYAAQKEMAHHMETRLSELGVPFFGSVARTTFDKVANSKLLELQKRMIEYLEASFGDDLA